jgi:[glutamine synthetase] adenylyltransferase / [glutamine synthetase]-adenylyl-L-tyrosine phosphorylase
VCASGTGLICKAEIVTIDSERVVKQIQQGSPYLSQLLVHQAEFASRAFKEKPEDLLREICDSLDHNISGDIFIDLRRAKAKAALLIAIADIAGVWDVTEVTQALTQFADASLNAAVNYVLRGAEQKNKLTLNDQHNPSLGCGYVVLAMGKHGAGELNYSSDIDLIVLYDHHVASLAAHIEPSQFFVRLTRELVALLQDVTSEGYVFRVDLRLRPDPGATQVAISMEAAAIYYENQGQNWERAAMIKARAAAGDIALGQEFLDRLKPYIWRKYLDYAAIADVQSMKRQIHAVKGFGEIAVRGHNLKLGRGGIREIEFFVQTQQLIAGGKNPKLRGLRTLQMLDALAQEKWIATQTAEELKSAYCFLRMLEHRAQMVDDLQTHMVPEKPGAFESYAHFSGFQNGEALSVALLATLHTVQRHYAALFEDADNLAGELGSLVFTGGEDDPATIETLTNMGFKLASDVSAAIRGWHFGRYAAMRTARARELLTELVPGLLKTLAQSGDADAAFIAFDQFLKALPSGIQFFSMVKANPNLLNFIALILGAAPRLAHQLSLQPRILEAVVSPGFFEPELTSHVLRNDIEFAIPNSTPRDEAMDRARIFVREHMFKVGAGILSETLSAEDAGRNYSMLADVVLEKLLAVIVSDLKSIHGELVGGACAIIALGKLGSFEMTAASDLDLILVYDHAEGDELSSGAKPMSATQYYARLTQRLVTALTVLTAEGGLYEVDLRLRPSGSKGPVAVSLESFVTYQRDSAWTWEKLALTRARVVAGDAGLVEKLNDIIRNSLTQKRDPFTTRKDVSDMRALMLRELQPVSIWDIKRVRGGLVEIEFMAQYLQLIHGHSHPRILNTNTHASLKNALELGVLNREDGEKILQAIGLYQRLTQLLRLCLTGVFDPIIASKNMKGVLCRAAEMPDMNATEAYLRETQFSISDIFARLVGRP